MSGCLSTDKRKKKKLEGINKKGGRDFLTGVSVDCEWKVTVSLLGGRKVTLISRTRTTEAETSEGGGWRRKVRNV